MEYEVRALADGRVTTVLVDALNESDARRQVAARSARPLSAKPRGRSLAGPARRRRSPFSLVLFSQELLTLLEAGLTVVEGLEALLEKERSPEVRNVLAGLLQNLSEGKSLSRALEEMPDIFPPLYVSIVRAAERTSDLHAALGRYIDYQVRLSAVKSRIVTASIYPAVLLAVGTLVCLFLLGYVVPRFSAVYQGSGRDLPWLSSLLLDWGNFVAGNRDGFLLGSLAGAALLAEGVRRLGRGGGLARCLLRLPFIADKVRTFLFARFYLTLGMLLDGGLPIVQGLGLVGELLTPDLQIRLQAATQAIQRGQSISQAFDRHGLTTPVGLRLLRVGEQSGRMGEMMARAARVYDTEVSRAIEWFTRVFEPILMAVIGVVIGGIVVLLYMPIFDLAGTLQ